MIAEITTVLTEATLIPLGVAIVAAGTIIMFVWRISAQATQVIARLDAIEKKLNDHWTRADQLEWILALREVNPTMKIPMPRPQHTENP